MLKNFLSSEDKYCEGYFATSKNNNYFLGVNFSVAQAPVEFSHPGSRMLDEIMAFDLAEIKEANIGQINMMAVSSFCGPRGRIWGLDACAVKKIGLDINVEQNRRKIPVYDINPLKESFKELVGTIQSPRFPFMPGSHVPCAVKTLTVRGPKRIYSALGIGIPENREENACLLMEDVGGIPENVDVKKYRKVIMENLAKSIISIGKNHHTRYKEIFTGTSDLLIGTNEIGCALVACPYFLLAGEASPADESVFDISLDRWKTVSKLTRI